MCASCARNVGMITDDGIESGAFSMIFPSVRYVIAK
jgi:hypothetical protein